VLSCWAVKRSLSGVPQTTTFCELGRLALAEVTDLLSRSLNSLGKGQGRGAVDFASLQCAGSSGKEVKDRDKRPTRQQVNTPLPGPFMKPHATMLPFAAPTFLLLMQDGMCCTIAVALGAVCMQNSLLSPDSTIPNPLKKKRSLVVGCQKCQPYKTVCYDSLGTQMPDHSDN